MAIHSGSSQPATTGSRQTHGNWEASATVVQLRDSALHSHGFPGICICDDHGGLLAIHRYSEVSHYVDGTAELHAQWSYDGGYTWSHPEPINTPVAPGKVVASKDARGPNLTRLNDGRIALATFVWISNSAGSEEYYTYVLFSSDAGHSWTTPVQIDPPGGLVYGSNAQRCPIVELDNGDLVTAIYGWETVYTGGDRHAVLVRSTDGGATWGSEVEIAHGANDGPGSPTSDWGEPFLVLTDVTNGVSSLACSIRENSTERLWMAWSTDDGATWTDPVNTGVVSTGSPGLGRVQPNGPMFATPRSDTYQWYQTSWNDGHSFLEKIQLDDGFRGAYAEMEQTGSNEIGLLWSMEPLDAGEAHLRFTKLYDTEHTDPFTCTYVDVSLTADDSDQTSTLQAAIDAAPDGTKGNPTIIRLPGGQYRLDDTITLTDRNYLTITGPWADDNPVWFEGYTDLDGRDFNPVKTQRQHWRLTDCTGITLNAIKVQGPNDERDAQTGRTDFALYVLAVEVEHGFAVRGSSDVTISNCEAHEVYGDSIYFGASPGLGINSHCRVFNFTGTYPGRQSIAITHADDIYIQDVDIRWGARSGLDIEPLIPGEGVSNVTLKRCALGSLYYAFRMGGGGYQDNIVLDGCSRPVGTSSIAHSTISSAPSSGGSITIRNHSDELCYSKQAMVFKRWENVTIEDSSSTVGPQVSADTYGIVLQDVSGDVVIRNNTYNGFDGYPAATAGADYLYALNVDAGTIEPASITTCGNEWSAGTQTDNPCA